MDQANSMQARLEKAVGVAVERFVGNLGGDGRAAVWFEHLTSGLQWQMAADEVYPAASVIKVAILVEAFRQAEQGQLLLESLHAVPEHGRAGGAGVLRDLHLGLAVTVRDLLTLMIIVSDNTATNMCIDLVGMRRVNDMIGRLGLQHTVLRRKLMGGPFYDRPDYSLAIDNTLSAIDMGILLGLLARGQAVSPAADAVMRDILLRQQVNDRLPLMLPRGTKVAHKTGEFQTTRHDAGIVYGPDGPMYTLVVLTRDLKDPARAAWQVAELSREIWECCSTT